MKQPLPGRKAITCKAAAVFIEKFSLLSCGKEIKFSKNKKSIKFIKKDLNLTTVLR